MRHLREILLMAVVVGLKNAHTDARSNRYSSGTESAAISDVDLFQLSYSTSGFVTRPSSNLSDVQFLLWTRSNPSDKDHYRLLPQNLTNLNESPIDVQLKTHFMFHGYNDYGLTEWILKAKKDLLELHNCNVISVDWATLVPRPWYEKAVKNAFLVGQYTADLIDWLHEEKGLNSSQIHIVGHSLGGHTAGFAGKYVKSGQVARVTSLDPAGPLFYDQDKDHRIDKSDAAYVDVIHANSGSFEGGCYGLYDAVGHADFYPNGGHHQPGCVPVNSTVIDDIFDMIKNCSHARVTDLWVESITADGSPHKVFTSWPCSDYQSYVEGKCTDCGDGCPNMGFHVNESLRGKFYLRTNAVSPYAKGEDQ